MLSGFMFMFTQEIPFIMFNPETEKNGVFVIDVPAIQIQSSILFVFTAPHLMLP